MQEWYSMYAVQQALVWFWLMKRGSKSAVWRILLSDIAAAQQETSAHPTMELSNKFEPNLLVILMTRLNAAPL